MKVIAQVCNYYDSEKGRGYCEPGQEIDLPDAAAADWLAKGWAHPLPKAERETATAAGAKTK